MGLPDLFSSIMAELGTTTGNDNKIFSGRSGGANPSTGCWTCDASSFLGCAQSGRFETCPTNSVCFVEMREEAQQLVSISTGCQNQFACSAGKRQNFVGGHLTRNQCKPDYRLQRPNSRFGSRQSVCRQCFLQCENTDQDTGDYCFGGLDGNLDAQSDGKWFGYDFTSTNWHSPSFQSSMSLGIPTWAKIQDSNDVAVVEDTSTRLFWGDAFANTDAGKDSTDLSGPLATTMVYWGLQDTDQTFWSLDLLTQQQTYFAADVSGAIFN